jgi:hypothetical protein
MKIEHFILANNSSIDINTNTLSVFGIMEDMQIQAPPGTNLGLTFHAVLVVKRESEVGVINSGFVMTVFAPNGSKIGQEVKMPLSMQPAHRRSRLRVIAEIPVLHSGNYRVRMENSENQNIAAEVNLHIQIMPVAVPPPSQLPQ